jgi:hypothetical protein
MLKFISGNVDYSTYTTSLQFLEITAKADYSALYSIYMILFKLKNIIKPIYDKLNQIHNPNENVIILKEYIKQKYTINLDTQLTQIKNKFKEIPNIGKTYFNVINEIYGDLVDTFFDIEEHHDDNSHDGILEIFIKNTGGDAIIQEDAEKIRKAVIIGKQILEKAIDIRKSLKKCKYIAKNILSKKFNYNECIKKEQHEVIQDSNDTGKKEDEEIKDEEIKDETFNIYYKKASLSAKEADKNLNEILKVFKGDTIPLDYVNKDPVLKANKQRIAASLSAIDIRESVNCIDKKVRDFYNSTTEEDKEEDKEQDEEEDKEAKKARKEANKALINAEKAEKKQKIINLLKNLKDNEDIINKAEEEAINSIKQAILKTIEINIEQQKTGIVLETDKKRIDELIITVKEKTELVKKTANETNIKIKEIKDEIDYINQLTSSSDPSSLITKSKNDKSSSSSSTNISAISKKIYESSTMPESVQHSADELFMSDYIKKVQSGEKVTKDESKRYNDLKAHYETNADGIENDKVREKIKKNLEVDLSQHELNEIDGFILNFKLVAKIFRTILLFITSLCIIMYIFVLLLSIFNVFNLLLQIFLGITSIFYNKKTSNNETLSYKVKNILKCSKDNYKHDILNVLNEQMSAVSIFNLTLYIVYLLLFYCIIYIIYVVISSVPLSKDKKYTLVGSINDIDDPSFSLLGVTAAIFVFSIIHLFYYKFLFKSISYRQYKDINSYEQNIDNLIRNIVKNDNETFDVSYFTLLKDSSKRKQIDDKISNEISDLNSTNNNNNNLYAYLLIYDIYIYLEHNTHLNDVKRAEVQNYFDKIMQGSTPDNTFISFLDTNERKLIKPYHEELPFYKNIPQDKIEFFEPINENISTTLSSINKNIISYSGTFNAFLFTCIYIITICIYNFICVYIVMKMIINAGEGVFHQYIVWMALLYVKYIDLFIVYISKLFNK